MKITHAAAELAIKVGTPFEASNLRGVAYWVLSSYPDTGEMPAVYAEALSNRVQLVHDTYMGPNLDGHDFGKRIGNTYVVFSYNTPIGWLERDDEMHVQKVCIPDVTYGTTTSKHQAMLRRIWDGLASEV